MIVIVAQPDARRNPRYNNQMLPVYPVQRIYAIAHPHNKRIPSWTETATPLERALMARYAHEHLVKFAPLNALESLIASKNPRSHEERDALHAYVRSKHPTLTAEHLKTIVQDGWSLGKDTVWPTLALDEQRLLLRYAAVYKNMLRPWKHGQYSVQDVDNVLKSARGELPHDPMVHQIVAVNNPSLLAYWIQTRQPVDEMALAIAMSDCQHRADRSWYNKFSDHTFACLIAHLPERRHFTERFQLLQEFNKPLFFYPWDKVHVLLEHNPVRFIHSVLANHDVANGFHHVKKWFRPMLDATAVRCSTDPTYTDFLFGVLHSRDGQKRFDKVLRRYDPEAFSQLQVLRELHAGTPDAKTTSVLDWLRWVAHREEPIVSLDLPELSS